MSTDPSLAETQKTGAALKRKFLFDRSFHEDAIEESHNQDGASVTYSAEDMEAARKESYDTGYKTGQKAATDKQQQGINILLAQLDQQIASLVSRSQQQWQRILDHMQETALTIMRKVMPSYTEVHGTQEIQAIITQVLTEMAHEPRLVVRVGESRFDEISSQINALAEQKAYMGKIAVLCENNLGPSDCRVEWADGGIERDINALWQDIDRIMKQGSGEST